MRINDLSTNYGFLGTNLNNANRAASAAMRRMTSGEDIVISVASVPAPTRPNPSVPPVPNQTPPANGSSKKPHVDNGKHNGVINGNGNAANTPPVSSRPSVPPTGGSSPTDPTNGSIKKPHQDNGKHNGVIKGNGNAANTPSAPPTPTPTTPTESPQEPAKKPHTDNGKHNGAVKGKGNAANTPSAPPVPNPPSTGGSNPTTPNPPVTPTDPTEPVDPATPTPPTTTTPPVTDPAQPSSPTSPSGAKKDNGAQKTPPTQKAMQYGNGVLKSMQDYLQKAHDIGQKLLSVAIKLESKGNSLQDRNQAMLEGKLLVKDLVNTFKEANHDGVQLFDKSLSLQTGLQGMDRHLVKVQDITQNPFSILTTWSPDGKSQSQTTTLRNLDINDSLQLRQVLQTSFVKENILHPLEQIMQGVSGIQGVVGSQMRSSFQNGSEALSWLQFDMSKLVNDYVEYQRQQMLGNISAYLINDSIANFRNQVGLLFNARI